MTTSRTPLSKKTTTTKKSTSTASAKPPASTAKTSTSKAAPKARAKTSAASSTAVPPKPADLTPAAAAPSKPRSSKKAPAKKVVTPEERYQMIAAAAYFLAERHGFTSGRALDDWIAAEKEIDGMLKSGD